MGKGSGPGGRAADAAGHEPPTGVPKPNYTQVPNVLLDEWLPQIDSLAELKVALVIVRATLGWHQQRAVLTMDEIQARSGLSSRGSVVDGVRRALEHGFIARAPVGRGFSYRWAGR